MPQRSSLLAGQMLIYQHLTDLAILAEFFLTLFLLGFIFLCQTINQLQIIRKEALISDIA